MVLTRATLRFIWVGMNRLTTEDRSRILTGAALKGAEGNSIRAVTRLTGASRNYANQRNARTTKATPPDQAGDTWTWTALDAESRLAPAMAAGVSDRLWEIGEATAPRHRGPYKRRSA